MRISLNWLKELVDIQLNATELAEKLTMAGFEVEHIEDRRTWAQGVVVGRVTECAPHPQADRLRVCRVDAGGPELTIVCGAPNARADIYVAVATVGARLPMKDPDPLRRTVIRGVPSEGMLCSLAELGLAKESEGIYVFEEPQVPGTDVRPLLDLDDVILEVASTANRADALSMVGIAREVAALSGGVLRYPLADIPPVAPAQSVKVEDPQTCPVYTATLLEDVSVAPSPTWLRQRIEKAGLRSINNVVDVTNYILLEWGQPLHAFDYERLANGSAIGVRHAYAGEVLTTLDGVERTLEAASLIITSANQPIALAGVMGGQATEVGPTTHTVLLEAAVFDPATIRRSARVFGLRSEASARYERGVDGSALEKATDRALELLSELTGARPVTQARADFRRTETRTIQYRPARFEQIMGETLALSETVHVLKNLGFDIVDEGAGQDTVAVVVPGHRLRDIEREIDLIEEVARIIGYQRFGLTLPAQAEGGYLPYDEQLLRQVRAQFRGAGLTEVVAYSLTTRDHDGQVTLSNPLTVELTALRTDLMSGLLGILRSNWSQEGKAFWAFEIGTVFLKTEDGIEEVEHLGGVLHGNPVEGDWQKQSSPFNWYAAKGRLTSIFRQWHLEVEYQPDRQDERLHPGRTASLWLDGERLGVLGQVHPRTARQLGIPEQTCVFELDLDLWIEKLLSNPGGYRPFSTYPASDRDIAFFTASRVSVAEIERVIRDHGEPLLESVALFDEYRGAGVPEGQRSLAFRLVYRAADRTLTEAEVNRSHQQVREALVERYNVELRS